MVRSDLADPGVEAEDDAVTLQHLGRVAVGLGREGDEESMAVVHERHAGGRRPRAGYSAAMVVRIISARAPATSTPVGPPPTTTNYEGTFADERTSRVRGTEPGMAEAGSAGPTPGCPRQGTS